MVGGTLDAAEEEPTVGRTLDTAAEEPDVNG